MPTLTPVAPCAVFRRVAPRAIPFTEGQKVR